MKKGRLISKGVFKMTKPSKEVEKIEQWLADPWTVDIEELWQQATDNPDPDKRKLFDALYTYVLDKRQDDIIKRKDFVI